MKQKKPSKKLVGKNKDAFIQALFYKSLSCFSGYKGLFGLFTGVVKTDVSGLDCNNYQADELAYGVF